MLRERVARLRRKRGMNQIEVAERFRVIQPVAVLRRVQEIERLPRRDQQPLLRTVERFVESFRPQ